MQSKHAKYHWCPDPTNLTGTEYISGWPVGACPEFLYPPDNGCPENYDPVTDEVCLRISAYPASYEDAKAKCVSEGGFLLQYTDSLIEVHMIQKFSQLVYLQNLLVFYPTGWLDRCSQGQTGDN